MEMKELTFFIKSKHTTQLDPQNTMPDSEAELYKPSENDDKDYTRNTTAWD